MFNRTKGLLLMTAGVLSASVVPSALAQDDNQPVKIVIGFAPGASTDALARLLADKMRVSLGVPVIVENKPGASTRLAIETVKRAAPDGKTLLITPVATMSIFPAMYKSALRYDPVKDFAPVSHIATFQYGIAVGTHIPVKTVKELAEWSRANPKEANYGTPGSGTVPHLFGVMFAKTADLPFLHVPYKGSAPSVSDVIGGQLPMVITSEVDLIEMHKAGKLRVLATAGSKRSSHLPQVPTFKEAGYNIEGVGWFGLYAPARTSSENVQKLNRAAIAALKEPDVKEKLAKLGLEPTGTSSGELAAIQKADVDRWTPIVHASGFHPDQ